jgi:hypothetical protein
MTQINLKYVELHNPLFLCGMNCGTKLDLSNSKYAAMKLVYDRAEKELLVHWREEIGIIPYSNISAMIEGEAKNLIEAIRSGKRCRPVGTSQWCDFNRDVKNGIVYLCLDGTRGEFLGEWETEEEKVELTWDQIVKGIELYHNMRNGELAHARRNNDLYSSHPDSNRCHLYSSHPDSNRCLEY